MKTFNKLLLLLAAVLLLYSFITNQVVISLFCLIIGLYLYYFKYEDIFGKSNRKEQNKNECSK